MKAVDLLSGLLGGPESNKEDKPVAGKFDALLAEVVEERASGEPAADARGGARSLPAERGTRAEGSQLSLALGVALPRGGRSIHALAQPPRGPSAQAADAAPGLPATPPPAVETAADAPALAALPTDEDLALAAAAGEEARPAQREADGALLGEVAAQISRIVAPPAPGPEAQGASDAFTLPASARSAGAAPALRPEASALTLQTSFAQAVEATSASTARVPEGPARAASPAVPLAPDATSVRDEGLPIEAGLSGSVAARDASGRPALTAGGSRVHGRELTAHAPSPAPAVASAPGAAAEVSIAAPGDGALLAAPAPQAGTLQHAAQPMAAFPSGATARGVPGRGAAQQPAAPGALAAPLTAPSGAPAAEQQPETGAGPSAPRAARPGRGPAIDPQVLTSGLLPPATPEVRVDLTVKPATTADVDQASTAGEAADARGRGALDATAAPVPPPSAQGARALADPRSVEVLDVRSQAVAREVEGGAARTRGPIARHATEGLDTLQTFTRGSLTSLRSAYAGRGHQGAEHDASPRDKRAELEEHEGGAQPAGTEAAAPTFEQVTVQVQPAREAAPPDAALRAPAPMAAPVPVPELPDFDFGPRVPVQAENASISLHHPDLGPIQLEVHRAAGRVEVHALIESAHAEAVLRANESGIRYGVQQSGMALSALRVRVRGEGEQTNTARGAQMRSKRRTNERGA